MENMLKECYLELAFLKSVIACGEDLCIREQKELDELLQKLRHILANQF